MRRVIVAYQNNIVMEPTLDQAMARLFGTKDRATAPPQAGAAAAPPSPTSTAAPTTGEWERIATEAGETYRRAIEAQRAGDWARYGEEIKRLGGLLEQLKRRQ